MCVLRYRQQSSSLLLKFLPGLFGRSPMFSENADTESTYNRIYLYLTLMRPDHFEYYANWLHNCIFIQQPMKLALLIHVHCHRTYGANRTTLYFLVTLRRAVWQKHCDVCSARAMVRCSAAAPAVRGVLRCV